MSQPAAAVARPGGPPEWQRVALFFGAGAVAAAINVVTRVWLSGMLSYRWSVLLAYLVGMAVAFGMNKYLVFERSGKPVHHELLWFVLINLLGMAQVWGLSVWLAEYWFPRWQFHWHAELVAHLASVAPLAVTSYLGHKLLSFARRRH